MYQVIEYSDYHKENHITLHGVTDDLKKACEKAKAVVEDFSLYTNDRTIHLLRDLAAIDNNYNDVTLTNNKKHVYCIYTVTLCDSLFTITVGDLYGNLDRLDIPVNSNDIVTEELFKDLVNKHKFTVRDLEALSKNGYLYGNNHRNRVAVIKCDVL